MKKPEELTQDEKDLLQAVSLAFLPVLKTLKGCRIAIYTDDRDNTKYICLRKDEKTVSNYIGHINNEAVESVFNIINEWLEFKELQQVPDLKSSEEKLPYKIKE